MLELKLDKGMLLDFVSSQLPELEALQIERALELLNLERLYKVQAERYSWAFWSGEAINGCPREELIELGMVIPADSEFAFVIRDSRTGRVVHFQPFDPQLQNFGALTSARARELAQLNINKLACQSSLAAIVEAVKSNVQCT